MAEKEIRVPPLGDDGPEEAIVSYVSAEEGEPVRKDQKVAEILTDKATFDITSPVDGFVKRVLVQEDETVKVGQVLAVIEFDESAAGSTQEKQG